MPDWNCIAASFETKRLLIEPLQRHHAELFFPLLQEPSIYTWISSTPPANLSELQRLWSEVDHYSIGEGGGLFQWAVKRLSDGAWIGKMDADILPNGVATNVGYLFFPKFWGQGFATEAMRSLSGRLRDAGVSSQRALVTDGNEASAKVLEKVGFRRMRIIPENDFIRGIKVDDIEYRRE